MPYRVRIKSIQKTVKSVPLLSIPVNKCSSIDDISNLIANKSNTTVNKSYKIANIMPGL